LGGMPDKQVNKTLGMRLVTAQEQRIKDRPRLRLVDQLANLIKVMKRSQLVKMLEKILKA